MSEASPAIIGSIVGAYLFALFGCAGTALWFMRLNKTTAGPIYAMEKTAEPFSMPTGLPGVGALTGLPGVGALTGLADKIPGGNPLDDANSVTGGKFPVPALGGKDIPGLSSIPNVTSGKFPITGGDAALTNFTSGKFPGGESALTNFTSGKMPSNIEMSTFSKGNNPLTAMAGNNPLSAMSANKTNAEKAIAGQTDAAKSLLASNLNKSREAISNSRIGGGKKTKGRRTK